MSGVRKSCHFWQINFIRESRSDTSWMWSCLRLMMNDLPGCLSDSKSQVSRLDPQCGNPSHTLIHFRPSCLTSPLEQPAIVPIIQSSNQYYPSSKCCMLCFLYPLALYWLVQRLVRPNAPAQEIKPHILVFFENWQEFGGDSSASVANDRFRMSQKPPLQGNRGQRSSILTSKGIQQGLS